MSFLSARTISDHAAYLRSAHHSLSPDRSKIILGAPQAAFGERKSTFEVIDQRREQMLSALVVVDDMMSLGRRAWHATLELLLCVLAEDRER